jgi:hypothetical protein
LSRPAPCPVCHTQKESLLSPGTKGAISQPQGRGWPFVDQGQSDRDLKRFRGHIHGHGLESGGEGLDACTRTIPGQSQVNCSPSGFPSDCRGEHCASNSFMFELFPGANSLEAFRH